MIPEYMFHTLRKRGRNLADGLMPLRILGGRFSLHVAVRSANERIFAERKATYLPTVERQNA
jgi:hypothetical protein